MNRGARFLRKAEVPSFLSSVSATKYEASRNRSSLWFSSTPLFSASSDSLTAVGAFDAIIFKMAIAFNLFRRQPGGPYYYVGIRSLQLFQHLRCNSRRLGGATP